jgi:hypothetical protein
MLSNELQTQLKVLSIIKLLIKRAVWVIESSKYDAGRKTQLALEAKKMMYINRFVW